MKRYRVQALCLLLAAALALTGCAARRGEEDTGKLQVVCTLFPYYDFVRQIGGDDVDVTLLVAAGKETHSFEPTFPRRTCSSATAAKARPGWTTSWTPPGRASAPWCT